MSFCRALDGAPRRRGRPAARLAGVALGAVTRGREVVVVGVAVVLATVLFSAEADSGIETGATLTGIIGVSGMVGVVEVDTGGTASDTSGVASVAGVGVDSLLITLYFPTCKTSLKTKIIQHWCYIIEK